MKKARKKTEEIKEYSEPVIGEFDNRQPLRNAIHFTNINKANFFEKRSMPQVIPARHKNSSLDYLYKSEIPEVMVQETTTEQVSLGSGLFTADSKINEYPKVNSFYEKQQ